jgi:hypothetical protein
VICEGVVLRNIIGGDVTRDGVTTCAGVSIDGVIVVGIGGIVVAIANVVRGILVVVRVLVVKITGVIVSC